MSLLFLTECLNVPFWVKTVNGVRFGRPLISGKLGYVVPTLDKDMFSCALYVGKLPFPGPPLCPKFSSWSNVPLGPADYASGVAEAFASDRNSTKINLAIGTYRDNNGDP